jgi:lipopolysaccharide transport system ATP-binding protein
MSIVISVENLSKTYHLGQIGTGTFADDLKVWWAKTRGKPNPLLKIGQKDHSNRDGEELWALRDVSFTVEQGEVLGIIGRNGAGKSTLLKILSRVTAPTSGKIRVKGRIASLLEVGTGFHPELTGRENIYLNGAILGMSKQEVTRKFDEIVDFAEVEKFIDTPVKRYSSGMYVRLAFAVAAHLDPEILVVDEVLAVGDAAFQKKCLGKMGDVAKEGRTVLFVSHNMGAVANLCNRAVLLDGGRIVTIGAVDNVVGTYSEIAGSSRDFNRVEHTGSEGEKSTYYTGLALYDSSGRTQEVILSGDYVCFALMYGSRHVKLLKNVIAEIKFMDNLGQVLFTLSTYLLDVILPDLSPNGKIYCEVPYFPLFPGIYAITLVLFVNGELVDHVDYAYQISVIGSLKAKSSKLPKPILHGSILVLHEWSVEAPFSKERRIEN